MLFKTVVRLGPVSGVCFWSAVSLPSKKVVWFSGRMAFGEKDNQGKMGSLGFHLRNYEKSVGKKTFNPKVPNEYSLGVSINSSSL